MKKSFARIISLLLVIVLAVGCLAPLTSCQKPDEGPSGGNNGGNGGNSGGNGGGGGGSNTGATASYEVTVSSRYGMPLKNIWAVIYDSTDSTQTVDQAKTDANGKASFKLDSSKTYTVKLEGVPEGYQVGSNAFSFDATRKADIKLTSAPISDGDINDVDMYQVGDVIHDFFLTDVNGEEFLISSVLQERNLLVLNFWYTGCGPCVQEIPFMIQAYENYNGVYGNVVEIFGINDYGESASTIKNFQVEVVDPEGNASMRPINFPVFKADDSVNGFSSKGLVQKFYQTVDPNTGAVGFAYPISVFIDRAGVICCIEAGGLPSEQVWTNAFNHFNAADYKQKVVDSIGDFSPIEKPNVTPPSFDEIGEVLTGNYRDTGNKIQVTYRWEKNEYSWPFIIEQIGNTTAVRPSNFNKDNSYAILIADVYLEAGDALVFDYLSSTQNNSLGSDYMVMIVDGKDIYTIRGMDTLPADGEAGKWNTCCTFVAKESKTYEVAFSYIKDYSGYMGRDGVFVRNLRVVDESEIDTETYIFRYAATNKDEWGSEFGNYVEVVLGADGYLHVGSADGPILFAQLVETYTQFDERKTIFERLYASTDEYGNPIFLVNGENKFSVMEAYGNYASNSKLPGLCPVTPELKTFLDTYAKLYFRDAGKLYNENTWLQLCCYYDAYGTGGKQLEDPIKGLAPFSAPQIELDKVIEVTYDTILVPRGYLYSFTPTEDGVYRVTSYGASTKLGWIFTSTSNGGAGQRVLFADSETHAERLSPELIFNGYKVVCPSCFKDVIYPKQYDEDGVEIDPTDLCCDDPFCVDEEGYATKITDLSEKVAVVSIDHDNISMVVNLKANVTYYVAVAFHDPNALGTLEFKMTKLDGSYKQFAPVSPGSFTFELTEGGGMGQTIAGGKKVRLCDIDGCHDCADMAQKLGKPEGTKYYHVINSDGSLGSLVFVDFHLSTSIFPSNSLKDVIDCGMFDFSKFPAKTELDNEAINILTNARNAGISALFDLWIIQEMITEEDANTRWLDYSMFEVMNGDFSSLEELENAAQLIAQATEWRNYVLEKEDEWLHDYFGAEYDEKWAYYQMDDVKAGIYHGQAEDYTDEMQAYVALLLDEADHPERQGCIAVDEELAKMLQLLMDKETFEGVENSWVKLAYYYATLND